MPRKIIMFLWRLSHNTLPVRLNLKHRGIDLDTICPMCNRLDEDGGHAFLKCKFSKALWREAKQEHVRGLLLSCTDAKQSVETLLSLENATSMFCICLMWNLWNARNAVNNGDRCPSAAAIVSSTAIQVTEFSKHLHIPSCSVIAPNERWSKPPDDFLKINIDGSFLKDNSTGGWGFCVRDASGDVVGAGMGQIHFLSDALHAESIACLKAIEFATEVGFGLIIIETDSTVLATALLSNELDTARIGILFWEATFLLFTSFIEFKVHVCKRACNSVAHVLATHGAHMSQGGTMYWHDAVPDIVSSVVASDLAASASVC